MNGEWGSKEKEKTSFKKSSLIYVTFIVWLFCAFISIESLINIHTAKLCKINCTFSRNNHKNTPNLN